MRVLIVLGVAHAVAIYAFVRGFLLTRIHLPLEEYSSVDGDICPNPYKKLVWIVVDALRYVGHWSNVSTTCGQGCCE